MGAFVAGLLQGGCATVPIAVSMVGLYGGMGGNCSGTPPGPA